MGGTFTDLVYFDERSGRLGEGKVPTTPFTTYAQQVGSTLEVLILSLALAEKAAAAAQQ